VRETVDALPLSDKPSIAVLAFTNMSGDPEQEFFSDGIADDIITELSRSHSLFVIARNSSFIYRGQSVDVKRVARDLGVRYVLEGSVRRSGARVRVVAQLIDAGSGNHIWAERYDRALEDVFVVQDEITMAVVSAIHPAVADAEQKRALRKPPESLDAWEAYQRGLWHMSKFSGADSERAAQFLERAISLDPTFAAAYSNLALAYAEAGAVHAMRPLDETIALVRTAALKAVEFDPSDADAHAALGFATMLSGSRAGVSERLAFVLATRTRHGQMVFKAFCSHGAAAAPRRENTWGLRCDSTHVIHAMHFLCTRSKLPTISNVITRTPFRPRGER
jgi:adenylate cyclase